MLEETSFAIRPTNGTNEIDVWQSVGDVQKIEEKSKYLHSRARGHRVKFIFTATISFGSRSIHLLKSTLPLVQRSWQRQRK